MNQTIVKRVVWSVCGFLAAILMLIALAFADFIGCFHEPPLNLVVNDSNIVVHVETLGEYYTTVGRVRIEETSTGQIVYDAVAKSRKPQNWLCNRARLQSCHHGNKRG
jgi:hypothetical protein